MAHQLYLVEHQAIRLRKIGRTSVTSRLAMWRTRGWTVVDSRAFLSVSELHIAEWHAIKRLDELGARSSARMRTIFPNLDKNGRTEMFDPDVYEGDIAGLIDGRPVSDLVPLECPPPPWIAEARSEAARKATSNRDNNAAARKAWQTRRLHVDGGI